MQNVECTQASKQVCITAWGQARGRENMMNVSRVVHSRESTVQDVSRVAVILVVVLKNNGWMDHVNDESVRNF